MRPTSPVRRAAQNLAAVVGVILTTTLAIVLVAIPRLNRLAATGSADGTTGELMSAYSIRVLPVVLLYAGAGAACVLLLDSSRRGLWAVGAVVLGLIFSMLFYSVSLAGVPYRQEIELHLRLLMPVVGISMGAGLALLFAGRHPQST